MLHVSDVAAETLLGGSWPCRLFEVEGRELLGQQGHKFGFAALRVIRELPAWQALGPNGEAVVMLIEQAQWLNEDEARRLDAAQDAAWRAGRDAARGAVGCSARDAALALVARDLITVEQFDVLYGPWKAVVGL